MCIAQDNLKKPIKVTQLNEERNSYVPVGAYTHDVSIEYN